MSKIYTLNPARDMELILGEDCNALKTGMEASAYRKMYTIMFNAITDAMVKLQDAEFIMCKAQQSCEQAFMDEAEPPPVFYGEPTE